MAGLRTKRLPQLLGRRLLSLLENLTIPAVSGRTARPVAYSRNVSSRSTISANAVNVFFRVVLVINRAGKTNRLFDDMQ